MTAVPVSYGAADLLKVTVLFNFDRYVMIPRRATSTAKGTQKDNTDRQNLGSFSDQDSILSRAAATLPTPDIGDVEGLFN